MSGRGWRQRERCSLCHAGGEHPFETRLVLPSTPLANEFVGRGLVDVEDEDVGYTQDVFLLHVVACKVCGHLQLDTLVEPDRMFRDYVYATATSRLTIEHLANLARTIDARFNLRHQAKKPFIVEIGSNDGSLLKQFQLMGLTQVIGIDPAKEISAFANAAGVPTLCKMFSAEVAKDVLTANGCFADVVVACNVLAHVPDVRDMVEGIRLLIQDHGVLVMEVAHAGDVVREDCLAFDTIYHEHTSYHTLVPLIEMFASLGMRVIDAELSPGQVGRGSLRVWAAGVGSRHVADGAATKRIKEVLDLEARLDVGSEATWRRLEVAIEERRRELQGYLARKKDAGERVIGYGAPAKLTTLCYALGVTRGQVPVVVDDSPWKQGLFTPGLHIPVASFDEIWSDRPDNDNDEIGSMIVFAWNFADDIAKKLRTLGFEGEIAVPLPRLRLL